MKRRLLFPLTLSLLAACAPEPAPQDIPDTGSTTEVPATGSPSGTTDTSTAPLLAPLPQLSVSSNSRFLVKADGTGVF